MNEDITQIKGPFDRLNLLHIQWHIGNYCNYRCSYCVDPLRDGSYPFLPIETATRFVRSVAKQAAEKGLQLQFTISGGEPTVYKDLPELLEVMIESNAYSHVISNGSRSVAYYRRVAPLLSHGSTLTFHSDHAKIEHFEEIIPLFDPKLLMVYVPMNIAKWDYCVEAYERLSALGVRVIPKTVFEDFGHAGANTIVAYSKLQREFISEASRKTINTRIATAPSAQTVLPVRAPAQMFPPKSATPFRTIELIRADGSVELSSPQNLIINKRNDFRGMKCDAGINFLMIGFTGNVYRANCRPSKEVIANIAKDPDFPLPSDPIICDVPTCWCEADLMINKHR